MADVQANIVLTTTGGDESAAEISKATMAVNSLTSASSGMQARFQERFQHIGLMLFAGDALRASGLGMETRAVIMAMNTALTAATAGAGLASGGFLLLVTALVAVAGIAAKVIEHHKNEADALNKLIETQDKAYEGYEKEIDALNSISEHSDGLSDALEKWKAADEKVADDIKNNLLKSMDQEITVLEQQRDSVQKNADLHAAFVNVLDQAKAAVERLLEPFLKTISAIQTWSKELSALIPITLKHVELNDKQKQQIDEITAAIEKRRGQEELLANEGTTDATKVAQATKEAYDAEEKAWEQMSETISKGEKAQYDLITKLNKDITEDQKKQLEKQTAEHQKEMNKRAQIAKQFTDQMAGDFGKAVAVMVVEGKSFTQEMSKAFTNMAEQIIEMIVKMIAEWMVFEALTGLGGGAAAFGARMFPQFAGGQAVGGSTTVDTPTLFMAGEAGPEIATFTPMGSTAGSALSGGGGGNIQIGSVVTNVNGVTNPDQIAQQVGMKIIQQIRGQGQLPFTRA